MLFVRERYLTPFSQFDVPSHFETSIVIAAENLRTIPVEIAVRYILGIQHLLGKRFEPDLRPRNERVVSGLETVVSTLVR